MLDCVLEARDKYLRPGGALYPSHATIYLAPVIDCELLCDKRQAWEDETVHWVNFNKSMGTLHYGAPSRKRQFSNATFSSLRIPRSDQTLEWFLVWQPTIEN